MTYLPTNQLKWSDLFVIYMKRQLVHRNNRYKLV